MPRNPPTSVRVPQPLMTSHNQQLNAAGSVASFTEYELEATQFTIKHADDLSGNSVYGFWYRGSDGGTRFLMANGVNTAAGGGSSLTILSKAADATTTTG